jgi:hypothetical protein
VTVERAHWLERLISTLLVLTWGLWFGAIVMVFVTVTSLFETFASQRHLAGAAAAGVFHRFEWLHVGAAAVAVLAAATWVAIEPVAKFGRVLVLVPLALAAGASLTSTLAITPRIDNLRQHGLVDTPEFKKLHGISMAIYSAEAVSLLVAGLLLPGAIGFAGTVVVLPPADPA